MMESITGKMLIGGKLVESLDGNWLESIDPSDGSLLGRVPDGSKRDVDAAVDAALAAFPSWSALSMRERGSYVLALAEKVLERREEFAEIEARDTGNIINAMRNDVTSAVERMRFAAGLALQLKGETIPSTAGNLHLTLRVPFGVVGRIIPFNHPLGFAASRIAPPIVAGNTIVVKPSEQSPLSSSLLAELCAETLPPGVVNVVTGGRQTGEELVRHPKVKRLGFIGSAASGMAVQRAAAETAVKAVSLELGGKNPLIAFPDSDLERIASAAVAGMNFGWQGQSCGSTSRIILHDDIYDTVLGKIIDNVSAIKVGSPLDSDSNMGPINNRVQYEKVMQYIEIGRQEGADLVHGGGRPQGPQFEKGYWIEPTVFANVLPHMRIAREEIFGPVMSVFRFGTERQAVDLANDTEYGLTASLWTRDIDRALRLCQSIEAGYIWVNGVGSHFRNVPYGGLKNSGVGREEGMAEILSYTDEKAINIYVGASPE